MREVIGDPWSHVGEKALGRDEERECCVLGDERNAGKRTDQKCLPYQPPDQREKCHGDEELGG
ncbi:hypothetical protein [Mycolicibacterium fortuitum]